MDVFQRSVPSSVVEEEVDKALSSPIHTEDGDGAFQDDVQGNLQDSTVDNQGVIVLDSNGDESNSNSDQDSIAPEIPSQFITPNPSQMGDPKLSEMINILMKEKKQLTEDANQYKGLYNQASIEINSLTAKLNAYTSTVEELNKLKQLTSEQSGLLKQYETFIDQSKEHIKNVESIANDNRDLALSNKQKYDTLKEQYEVITSQLQSGSTELQALLNEKDIVINELKREIQLISEERNRMSNEAVSHLEDIKNIRSTLSQTEEQLNQLQIEYSTLLASQSEVQVSLDSKQSEELSKLQEIVDDLRLQLADSLTEKAKIELSSRMSEETLNEIKERLEQNDANYKRLFNSMQTRTEAFKIKEGQLLKVCEDLEAKNSDLIGQVSKLELSVSEANLIKTELEIELDNAQITCTNLSSTIESLTNSKEDLMKVVTTREEENQVLIEERSSVLNKLERMFSLSYLRGNVSLDDFLTMNPVEFEDLIVNEPLLNPTNESHTTELTELKNSYETLVNKCKSLETECERLSSNVSSLDKLVEDLREERDTTIKKAESLQSKLDSLTETCKQLKQELHNQIEESNALTEINNALKEENVKLSVESTKSAEVNPELLNKLNSDISKLEQQLITLRAKNQTLEHESDKHLKMYSEQLNENNKLRDTGDKLNSRKEKIISEFTQRNFGLSAEDLFKRFQELCVTIEIAEYNLQAMKDFPKAREIVNDKIALNKTKLRDIMTKPFQG